jgi:hypothetical protein
MAGAIVTSIEGKPIRVAVAENSIALFIDNVMHAEEKFSPLSVKPDRPMIHIDYPFPSGTKSIDVYGKMGIIFAGKCKLCINGQRVAGDSF